MKWLRHLVALGVVVALGCSRAGDDIDATGSESETGETTCLDPDAHPEIYPLLCPALTEGGECSIWLGDPVPCDVEPVDDGECACNPQIYVCGGPSTIYCCCMAPDIDGPVFPGDED